MNDCENPSRGRGLCQKHWARWRKHGDPMVVKRPGVDYMRKAHCSVGDCGRPAHAHGFCTMHLTRFQKHGDPLHIEPRRGRPLDGEHPTFAAIHKRLTRTLGRASEHDCVDCGGPAREWSYNNADPDELTAEISGRTRGRFTVAYSLDISNYDPRCTSCHRKFDQAHKRLVSTQGETP